MHTTLERLYSGENLSREETGKIFKDIMNGEVSDVMLCALLIALKIKGEQPQEIAGAAHAIQKNAKPFPRPAISLADSCGTGGDGLKTINVSTAVAFVAAACGVPMVKHGNRSVSSKCGSSDVLEALGVNIEHSTEVAQRCLDELGICFLFAPYYHQGIRHAMPVRNQLKTRTLFNLLGPLVNPAKPDIQLMGVYDERLCRPVAETLSLLGGKRAMVVHGSGLDEIALHGPTKVAELRDGNISEYTISPQDFGAKAMSLDEIVGGDAQENAQAIKNVLGGRGLLAHQTIIAMNTAALIYMSGKKDSLKDGMDLALATMHQGTALSILESLGERTNEQRAGQDC